MELVDKAVVAVSGGADSMYLLDQYRKSGLEFAVAHVNYGFREDADEDTMLVQNYCKKYGIVCCVLLCNREELPTSNIEEWARDIRYNFFQRELANRGWNILALGHNANDRAETIMINISRGRDFDGLGGIVEKTIHVISGYAGIPPYDTTIGVLRIQPETNYLKFRPMLGLLKSSIIASCIKEGIPFRTDSTNVDTKFLRNRIRSSMSEEEVLSLCKVADMASAMRLVPKELAKTVPFEKKGDCIYVDYSDVSDDASFKAYIASVIGFAGYIDRTTFERIVSKDKCNNIVEWNGYKVSKRGKRMKIQPLSKP